MTEDSRPLAAALTAFADEHPLPDAPAQQMFRTLLPDALMKATSRQADGTYFVVIGDVATRRNLSSVALCTAHQRRA